MDRIPNKQELYELPLAGFALAGNPLSIEQQVELRGIVDAEAPGIVNWILQGVSPAVRAAYLRRCGDADCATGARHPDRN